MQAEYKRGIVFVASTATHYPSAKRPPGGQNPKAEYRDPKSRKAGRMPKPEECRHWGFVRISSRLAGFRASDSDFGFREDRSPGNNSGSKASFSSLKGQKVCATGLRNDTRGSPRPSSDGDGVSNHFAHFGAVFA